MRTFKLKNGFLEDKGIIGGLLQHDGSGKLLLNWPTSSGYKKGNHAVEADLANFWLGAICADLARLHASPNVLTLKLHSA